MVSREKEAAVMSLFPHIDGQSVVGRVDEVEAVTGEEQVRGTVGDGVHQLGLRVRRAPAGLEGAIAVHDRLQEGLIKFLDDGPL